MNNTSVKTLTGMSMIMVSLSAIAVTILFAIYNMTSDINDKAFAMNASVKANTQINIDQNNRLNRHDKRLNVIDIRVSTNEKNSYKKWNGIK